MYRGTLNGRICPSIFLLYLSPKLGLFPDPMHLVDLAIIPDLAISLLLDWTDTGAYIALPSRQKRLDHLAALYKDFVGNDSDRCSKKLFTTEVLKPGSSAFVAVSQHYISAAAARGLLIWMAKVAQEFASETRVQADLPSGIITRPHSSSIFYAV